jgi:aspartyl-tRNA(Asn)/glutamyl-tRNA(Gln) amidotransferase subunit C
VSLTLEEVDHIAALARLRLTEEEKELYRQQLSAILEYFAQLQSLDTSGIPPAASSLPGATTLLRPDEPRPGLTPASLLGNAADSEANQFRVPPVLE